MMMMTMMLYIIIVIISRISKQVVISKVWLYNNIYTFFLNLQIKIPHQNRSIYTAGKSRTDAFIKPIMY